MPHKLNCWEFMNCGREPGGVFAEQLGVCPIATQMRRDGDNGGRAAGRVCWMVPATGKNGQSLKTCADTACQQCSFYKRVSFEQQPLEIEPQEITIISSPHQPGEIKSDTIEVA